MSVPAGIMGPMTDLFLEVRVDEERCIGCGRCQKTCAGVFDTSLGKAGVRVTRVPRELEDACFDALEDCPRGAISGFEVRDVLFGLVAS